MKRNIHLCNIHSKQVPDAEPIDISTISSIVNLSVDTIFCDSLESIAAEDLSKKFVEILNKVRPNGYLILNILDIKKLCAEYLQNTISNGIFLSLIKDKNNFISIDSIYSLIDTKSFQIMKIDTDQNTISVVIQRTKI
jgi:predicted SAM-dependent methyltransferase